MWVSGCGGCEWVDVMFVSDSSGWMLSYLILPIFF